MIHAEVSGGAEVIAEIRQFRDRAKAAILRVLVEESQAVEDLARAYASGPVIQAHVGWIRDSIHHTVIEGVNAAKAYVYSHSKAAAYHEKGYIGQQVVQAYVRTQKTAFGRAILSPRSRLVRTYTRRIAYEAHPFLGIAFDVLYPHIVSRLERAIEEANGT